MTWDLPLGTTIVHLPFWPSALALIGAFVAVTAAALIRQTCAWRWWESPDDLVERREVEPVSAQVK